MRAGSVTMLFVLALVLSGCTGERDGAASDVGDGSANSGAPDDGGATDPPDDADDGNSNDDGQPAENGTTEPVLELAVHARGIFPATIHFDPETLNGKVAQQVNLTFTNSDEGGVLQHRWVLVDVESAETNLLNPGKSQTIGFRLPSAAGEFTYLCDLQGHAEAGLTGTFVVGSG